MFKKIALTLIIAILLAACGQIQDDVPDTPVAQATQAQVEKFMAANAGYDADGLMALYAEDLVWMDYGSGDGPLTRGNLNFAVRDAMPDQGYEIKFESYLVTPDGRFAALDGSYAEISPLTGKWITVPFMAVLEFRDGLIINEEWYYNGSVFH